MFCIWYRNTLMISFSTCVTFNPDTRIPFMALLVTFKTHPYIIPPTFSPLQTFLFLFLSNISISWLSSSTCSVPIPRFSNNARSQQLFATFVWGSIFGLHDALLHPILIYCVKSSCPKITDNILLFCCF